MPEITEDLARWLLTDEGRAQTDVAMGLHADRAETLTALTRLRKAATPAQAAAAWELAELRERGRAKFGPDAARLFFGREALEQASSRRAAAYHARRLVQSGAVTVADVCGGIGGDALAFARAGLQVALYEQDPMRARFAAENAKVAGLADTITVVCADVTAAEVQADAVWFDPARRTARGRVQDPEEYQPPLSLVRRWQGQGIPTLGVKLAPAIEHRLAAEYGASLEFVSDGGECKEALLWVGGSTVTAVLLTEAAERRFEVDTNATVSVAGAQGGGVLYEPDPAVIRAHGVATLAARLGAQVLHPQIAYLLADEYTPTPFAAAYAVLERLPYSRRKLQEALTRLGVGQVVIKKRGFPQEPDAVRRELKLHGPESLTVILTRAADGPGHQALLCRSMAAGSGASGTIKAE